MSETGKYPLRICMDVQATQTEGSRHRGVGNYSASLTKTLQSVAPMHQLTVTANAAYPLDHASLGAPRYRSYEFPPTAGVWGEDPRRLMAEAIVQHCWRQVNADVLHVHHLFEGYVGKAVVPEQVPSSASMVTSTTLYDLIPLRFASHYLADQRMASWYRHRLATMVKFDLLLAISESSKRDAMELLGLPASQIVTIMGDCDPRYRVLTTQETDSLELRSRLGIRRDMVLYTGGDDHRKNLRGMLEGFAGLPAAVRDKHQLVIVCKLSPERKIMLERDARQVGLEPGRDVTFTGFVNDSDLVRLYNDCKLFVFPSLYEGFGLPVLEAMRCGAPTITGDNSSLPEIAGSKDALFDAASAPSLSAKLAEVLPNPEALSKMREHSLAHASAFSWNQSTRIAVEAWEEAYERKNSGSISVVVSHRQSKPRLAYFTPLPPTRSGIADYNASFLPYLARHFELDVYFGPKDEKPGVYPLGVSAILPWSEFEARAENYYAVFYEVGNSEFHEHMLELLAQYPGIVGLHDAYLSGLTAYTAFHGGNPAHFYREMVRSHGGRARQLLVPSVATGDPVNKAVRQLTCARTVFDHALGVISHSPFNVRIAHEELGHLVRQPYRVIPQLMAQVPLASDKEKAVLRARLGIAQDAFVIGTFGHIAWNKMGDTLLEAFVAARTELGRSAMLVLAGELSQDPFGDNLRNAVAQSPLQADIRVTGYLSDDDYRVYLAVCDVAVQLRIESRGGTPKGVLDCLAWGLPVVANRYASYTDYPEDVLCWVPAMPNVQDLAAELCKLRNDPARLKALSARGRDYVATTHDPSTCAAQYAAAVHDMVERSRQGSLERAVSDIATSLKNDPHRAAAVPGLSRSLLRNAGMSGDIRLLIDVSHIAAEDHQTGVSRVVRNLLKQAYFLSRPAFSVQAVRLNAKGDLVVAQEWLEAQGLLVPGETPEDLDEWGSDQDILLMLDASWGRYDQFKPAMQRWRERGGQIVTAVYDLIPIRLPDCVPEGGDQWFRKWLQMAVTESDALVCISRAVADDLIAYLSAENVVHRPGLRIGHWMLGGDFSAEQVPVPAPADASREDGSKRVLMVGTIEPRKQYGMTIDAFENLWAKGSELQLFIVGKAGWMCNDLVQRMLRHPEAGLRLHYFGQADDGMLARLYAQCDVLLFATKAEGFGLPILEAAVHDLPVLANDLPVLREIAEGHAVFARMTSEAEIAEAVLSWFELSSQGKVPPTTGLALQSWQQSCEQLIDLLFNDNWYVRM
jgi:glycosyltransferase involved in cell wall biosynthesis